ncbi:hypothetical protein HRbin36_02432 [bacterium HR36]|nr:hypothetical protein HRbin36_02432 [bacterium HR36]
MSWFGKTLVVINTVISLVLLGAITWMVLEWRQFRDDAQKIENQLKQQQGRWDSMRNILAGLLQEKVKGARPFVWEVRSEGKALKPQETITVSEARRRVNELENGGPGKPSLVALAKQLDDLHERAGKRREELDQAQQQTRKLGVELAKVSQEAQAILPAPGKPSPVDEMYNDKRELEAKIRDEEFPLNVARQHVQTLTLRHRQLLARSQQLNLLKQLPPYKPPPVKPQTR